MVRIDTHWLNKTGYTSMTDRLYYSNSYATAFDATLVEQIQWEGRPAVILDRTYFYPSSGGQPHDTGTLNGVVVVDVQVRDEDGAVVHILAAPVDGSSVTAKLNWERRFDHMQHHTGQHILTQAFIQAAGANTVSFHLSPDSVTIDLAGAALPDTKVTEVEALANRIVQENRPVTATLRQRDDMDSTRMRKLPKHIVTDGLRVIEIADFDSTACGGTHVAHTGEIGLIKIVKLERRGDKMRVEFKCGQRALADYAGKHTAISAIAADMNCRYSEIADNINRLRAELKDTQTTLKETRTQLSEYEAARLLAEADHTRGYALVTAVFEGRDAADVRLLTTRLTAGSRVVALLGVPGDKAQLMFARSADLTFDMGALLKEAVGKLGGRGGGQPTFAQGGGVKADSGQLEAIIQAIAQSLA